MKVLKFMAILAAFAMIAATSCKNNKEDHNIKGIGHSLLILNEGAFNSGNAELTVYNLSTKTSINNVFEQKNGRPLGDVGQSFYFFNDRYYIALNNSNKIEIVDADIVSAQVFNNIEMPRYMAFGENKIYVSSWANGGQVYVIDPGSGDILTVIATDKGSENMLLYNNNLYVANGGGFDYANTVSVINAATDKFEKNISAGDNPKEIVQHDHTRVWILNAGTYNSDWTEISGKGLMLANVATGAIEKNIAIPSTSPIEPNSLFKKGDTLYINHSGVYKMSVNATEFPAEPFINQNFNSVQLDEEQILIYGFTGNFSTNGNVYIINVQTGNIMENVEAGVGPKMIVKGNF